MINTKNSKNILKVYLLGMNERGRQTMRMFLERHVRDYCQATGMAEEAQAVLVDLDSYQAEETLQQHMQQFPQQRVIALSIAPEQYSDKDWLLVRKPDEAVGLKAALQQLQIQLLTSAPAAPAAPAAPEKVLKKKLTRARLTAQAAAEQSTAKAKPPVLRSSANEFNQFVGSAPDIDLNNTALHEKIFSHPENFLQGHVQHVLRLAAKNDSPMRLAGIGFKAMVVDPTHQRVISAVPLRSLLSAGRIPLAYKQMQLSAISEEEALRLAQDFESHSTESILWLLALCASRGRLPANTPLDTPISLAYWPNLTRLQVPPHAARILSLWVRQGCSLRETVSSLNVPQRYVFALYSACSAIGLVQFVTKQTQLATAAPNAPAAPEAQKKQGVFRMLIGKLNGYFD